jgi:dienelactone hydrolase
MTTVSTTDIDVEVEAADGWRISGLLSVPRGDVGSSVPGALLVPASRHQRDAYTAIAAALAGRGIASLRVDIRGRGASRGAMTYARMAPGQRQRVALDVTAALGRLAATAGIDPLRLALVAEQDTAATALSAVCGHRDLIAAVVVSARDGDRCADAIGRQPLPVFGLVSKEDRAGLRATVDAYLAGATGTSRLEVFDGLGFGTTMLSARQFEHPDAEPLEVMIAEWLSARLATDR